MLALLLAVSTQAAAAAAPSPAVAAAPSDPLAPYLRDTPRCDPARAHCFGIHLHIVQTADGPVQTAEWVSEQLTHVHKHFALIDTGLEIVAVDSLSAKELDIDDRDERDALGHDRFTRGVAHVFVVGRLADVDIAGNDIQGVHWRERADRSRRWVILARRASPLVLSHELGHFFGLRHSTYDISLMNKTVRPIAGELTFAEPEVAIMRKHRDRMLKSKMLLERKQPAE
ncbi:MAG: matrixin family metalloprotease [Myxococcales bacterium]|nr:matrixin family metalloprotease [Myxococcales bacterium]